jgi:hypothetical protein
VSLRNQLEETEHKVKQTLSAYCRGTQRCQCTDDLVHLSRQVAAHHATDMRAQTVSHALYAGGACPVASEVTVQESGALGHQPRVAQSRQVAGELRERLPVHREDIVVPALRVCCKYMKSFICALLRWWKRFTGT